MITSEVSYSAFVVFVVLAGMVWVYDVWSQRLSCEALTFSEAMKRSVLYIAVALIFALYLFIEYDSRVMSLYLSGYVMEKVLSIDNLMVFAAVFAYFRVLPKDQIWVLQYGILGAIVFRLIFVTVGVGALLMFGPVTEFIFGVLVAWSAWGLYCSTGNEEDVQYESMWYVKLARKLSIRPEIVCLIVIEIVDVLFAFDSVPVVIAITRDPVLIFSAMMFAILGLRALYFVLSVLRDSLEYLDIAVIAVLLLVAGKLMVHAIWEIHVDPTMSFLVVLGILSIGIGSSVYKRKGDVT